MLPLELPVADAAAEDFFLGVLTLPVSFEVVFILQHLSALVALNFRTGSLLNPSSLPRLPAVALDMPGQEQRRDETPLTQLTLMDASVRNHLVLLKPRRRRKLPETNLTLERIVPVRLIPAIKLVVHLRVLLERIFRRKLGRTSAALSTRRFPLDLVPFLGRRTWTRRCRMIR